MIGCSNSELYKLVYRPSYGTYDDGNTFMSDHEGDRRVLFTKSFDVDFKTFRNDDFAVAVENAKLITPKVQKLRKNRH